LSIYWLGQPVTIGPITVQQRNTDGTYSLVDAGTLTTVVYLAQADGTQATTGTYSSPTHISLGKYQQDVPAADLAVPGHYQWVVTTTGTGAGVTVGDFDVHDPKETAVLPLQDAKDQLNIPQTVTTYDSELQAYIAAIGTSLEGVTGGPLVNRTITNERQEMTSYQTVISVRQRPLVSVTSVTSASGGAIDLSGGLDIDANAGTFRRKLGLPFYGPFFQWLPQVNVTYVAGWGTSVPAAFNLFARIVLAHLWETQHGPSARPSMGGQELATIPGFAFAIPNRAAELLNGSLNGMPLRQEAYV
jgi:hypothetical protein